MIMSAGVNVNGTNTYIIVSAIVVGVLSVLLNYTGRQKYKDNSSFFESANKEVREQNSALREEKAALSEELAKTQAAASQKDETIKQLKPFSEVVKQMSQNHTEIMTALTEVTKKITDKVDGK